MRKELFQPVEIDSEVLDAYAVVKRLVEAFRATQDLLVKETIREMVWDAVDYAGEIRTRSEARKMSEAFHNLKNPKICLN